MISLLDDLILKFTELTDGMLWDDPASDPPGQKALSFYKYDCPPKRKTPGQGEDYPFCKLRILGGGRTKNPDVKIYVKAGLYTHSDDYEEGNISLVALFNKMVLVEATRGIKNGFLLLPETEWQFGNEYGEQNHPYYNLHFVLSFRVLSNITSRR